MIVPRMVTRVDASIPLAPFREENEPLHVIGPIIVEV